MLLFEKLTTYGVSPPIAARLVAGFPERIEPAFVAMFAVRGGVRNAAAFLVVAIEQNYQLGKPPGAAPIRAPEPYVSPAKKRADDARSAAQQAANVVAKLAALTDAQRAVLAAETDTALTAKTRFMASPQTLAIMQRESMFSRAADRGWLT